MNVIIDHFQLNVKLRDLANRRCAIKVTVLLVLGKDKEHDFLLLLSYNVMQMLV